MIENKLWAFRYCFSVDLSTPIKEYKRDNDAWSYARTWSQKSDRKPWSRQGGGEALWPLERCSEQPRSSEVVFLSASINLVKIAWFRGHVVFLSLIHLLNIDDEVKHQRGSSDSKPKDGDNMVDQPET